MGVRVKIALLLAALVVSGCGWRAAGGNYGGSSQESGAAVSRGTDYCQSIAAEQCQQSEENGLECDESNLFEACMENLGHERVTPFDILRPDVCLLLGLGTPAGGNIEGCREKSPGPAR